MVNDVLPRDPALTGELIDRLAAVVLASIGRDYPNQIVHLMRDPTDARPPRELHPSFHGSFDWHSAVHSHWSLVRLLRLAPERSFAPAALAALAVALEPAKIEVETAYFTADRDSFESPYGLAWLLTLDRELREWAAPAAAEMTAALEPPTRIAADRLMRWLAALRHPIRNGEHKQSAFAMGLALDWARATGQPDTAGALTAKALAFHANDAGWRLHWEPSGHDFLSPGLAEADLMRRVLDPPDFGDWLEAFLPEIPRDAASRWLVPVTGDPGDPVHSHLVGLNLSRAWMLDGIAAGLSPGDDRIDALRAASLEHRRAGIRVFDPEDFMQAHWIPTFVLYCLTERRVA